MTSAIAPTARPLQPARLRLIPLISLIACAGGGGGGGDGGSCDACVSGEVCVGNYDVKTEAAEERCEPTPEACAPLSCDDNACRGALYDLCDAGWIGVGCSPYDPVVIVSCNPD